MYKTLVIYFLHLFMYSRQSSLSSIGRPRNCTQFIRWIILLDIIKTSSSLSEGWDLQNIMHSVLEIFRNSLFARNQSLIPEGPCSYLHMYYVFAFHLVYSSVISK